MSSGHGWSLDAGVRSGAIQLLLASRQGGGATDDVQDVVVVKTEDEPLGAGEGAGDGADDDVDGVAVAVFEPVPGTAPVGLARPLATMPSMPRCAAAYVASHSRARGLVWARSRPAPDSALSRAADALAGCRRDAVSLYGGLWRFAGWWYRTSLDDPSAPQPLSASHVGPGRSPDSG